MLWVFVILFIICSAFFRGLRTLFAPIIQLIIQLIARGYEHAGMHSVDSYTAARATLSIVAIIILLAIIF
jgi:hypothetical protein